MLPGQSFSRDLFSVSIWITCYVYNLGLLYVVVIMNCCGFIQLVDFCWMRFDQGKLPSYCSMHDEQHSLKEEASGKEPRRSGSVLSSAMDLLCDLKQIVQYLHASVSSSVKWG